MCPGPMKLIEIEDIPSMGVQAEARRLGLAEVEMVSDNELDGDARVRIYRVGEAGLVAVGNGDPLGERGPG